MIRLLSGVSLVLGLTVASDAFAGCFEDTEVDEAVIQVDPESDCLILDVVGNECVGDASLVIQNNCPEPFIVACENCVLTVESGAERQHRIPLNDGEEMTQTVTGTLGAQTITIDLTYSGRVTNTYDDVGCSTTGAEPAAMMGLLGLLGVIRRRRRGDRPVELSPKA